MARRATQQRCWVERESRCWSTWEVPIVRTHAVAFIWSIMENISHRELDLFQGLSFDTISSTGPNGGEYFYYHLKRCQPSLVVRSYYSLLSWPYRLCYHQERTGEQRRGILGSKILKPCQHNRYIFATLEVWPELFRFVLLNSYDNPSPSTIPRRVSFPTYEWDNALWQKYCRRTTDVTRTWVSLIIAGGHTSRNWTVLAFRYPHIWRETCVHSRATRSYRDRRPGLPKRNDWIYDVSYLYWLLYDAVTD